MAAHATPMSTGAPRSLAPAAVLLLAPFYLNDFANLLVQDWRLWLAIDYIGVKLLPVLVVLWLLRSGRMQAAQFGLRVQSPLPFLVTVAGLSLTAIVIDQYGYALIAPLPGYAVLGGMPAIESPAWDWFDLTFGLLCVGIVEELVFRGFMAEVIGRYTRSSVAIVVISALVFGSIHWSLGLHVVVVTAVIGAVFMMAYLRTRSLPAIMLAHFAVNFIDFAGVIPKSTFRFL